MCILLNDRRAWNRPGSMLALQTEVPSRYWSSSRVDSASRSVPPVARGSAAIRFELLHSCLNRHSSLLFVPSAGLQQVPHRTRLQILHPSRTLREEARQKFESERRYSSDLARVLFFLRSPSSRIEIKSILVLIVLSRVSRQEILSILYQVYLVKPNADTVYQVGLEGLVPGLRTAPGAPLIRGVRMSGSARRNTLS